MPTGVGMIGAIGLGVFGLFTGQSWILLMIAVFGYFECWRMRKMLQIGAMAETGEFGYDFSQGYTSLEQKLAEKEEKPGLFQRRRARRTAEKAERERRRQEEHEELVEHILAKVSASGLGSLTPKERRILEAETARRRG